jgi:membrane peptidoglycan carboxypeptidase
MKANTKRIIIQRRSKKPAANLLIKAAIGLFVLILVGLTALALTGVGAVVGVYAYFAQDLPDPGTIEQAQKDFETTKIYDRTGQVLLYEIFDPKWGDRTYIPIDQIPLYLRQATVAIEDRTFYENPGVDLYGIGRAFVSNIRGEQVQGGSSITMQLVKNVLIPEEERYQIRNDRKIKAAILAL